MNLSMIYKLIFKNLKAYNQTIFIRILLLWFFFSAAFFFRFFPWQVYMMHAALTIVFGASVFSLKEKNHHIETLTGSLPVSRTEIVISRYLTTAIISISGLLIWFAFSYIADFVYSNPATHFEQIFGFKPVLIILFFVLIHTGFFIPALFRFNILGTIVSFVIAMVIALCMTLLFFDPFSRSQTFNFASDDRLIMIQYVIILILFLFISFILSLKLFQSRDLWI